MDQSTIDQINAILAELNQPARDARDMPHRVELCQRALALLPKQGNEQLWAALQGELGNALQQNPLGSRAENIEQAIGAYEQALTVRTQSAMPVEWATTMMNLAIAYSYRIRGERAENLEQAIGAYEQALTVRTQSAMPVEWATTMMNLAIAYSDRIRGERAENLEQAIGAYEQALTVMTQSAMPVEWATTMNNLAIAYSDRIRGDRAENIEQAIGAYQQALTVRTQSAMPVEWAQTMMNLATAYYSRIRGDRAENIEQAIAAYEQALTVRTQSAMPVAWATTMMNLATAYANRIRGERADNIEQAIGAYEKALTVMTQSAMPVEWATTMMNLANAYRDRIRGERADNIEQAIGAYEQALTVRTQSAMPVEWAQTINNLALAYANRIRGERADNIEQAIGAYEQALTVMTQSAMPVEWAGTMMNLANAYYYRIRGDRAENIEQAIGAYEQALTVRTKSAMPVEWATTMMNLATTYSDRIRGDRAENMEQAIGACEQALTVMTKSAMPVAWATTMMNLATAYADRIRGDRAENIEQAIGAYEQALTVRTQSAMPSENRRTLSNLGMLYFDESRWAEAAETYRQAIATSKDLFAASYSDTGRQSSLSESTRFYTRAAYGMLKTGQIGAALETLESGKARLLAESAAAQSAQLDMLTEEQREQFTTLQNEIRALEAEYRLPTDNPGRRDERDLSDALRESRAELRDLIDTLRGQHPDFMPEGLPLDELLANIPAGCVLVAPLFTTKGSVVFVVPGGTQTVTDDHLLWLDDITTDDLNALVIGTEENPGWLLGYVRGRGSGKILNVVNDIGAKLWEVLVGRLHAHLNTLGADKLLVMPPGTLGLLPLHAAWREVDGERRYLCDDYEISYTPSMFALASARRRAGQQGGHQALVAGVSKYNRLGDLPNTATEARTIAKLFGSAPLVDGDVTQSAVIEGVKGVNILHMACHGSAAWGNDWHDAALFLHNDEPLRLAEIIGKLALDHTRLVVLSACETGITDWRNTPDEFLGLPIGFMQAGAGTVVSSLWTVEDRSTALLMEKFYEFYLDEEKPCTAVTALRQAQEWLRKITVQELGDHYESYLRMSKQEAQHAVTELLLRDDLGDDDKPYEHPFYWAAFKVDGVV